MTEVGQTQRREMPDFLRVICSSANPFSNWSVRVVCGLRVVGKWCACIYMINSWEIKWKLVFLSLLNKLRRINLLYGSFFIKLKPFLFCHRYQSKATPNTSAVMNTGSPSSLQERGRDSCLRAVLCYKRLFAKAWVGCKRFFLKARKNVMFVNKIDLPHCLVVFSVVCPRLRPFWSVFRELALFWCSTATKRRETRVNNKEYNKAIR